MFDYNTFKCEVLNAVSHIGFQTSNARNISWLDSDQLSRIRAKNMITDERWQYRLLANRTILAEISYGWMMDAPVLGLTVFHKDPASREWDYERSKAVFSVSELVEALEVLNAGRELDAPDLGDMPRNGIA